MHFGRGPIFEVGRGPPRAGAWVPVVAPRVQGAIGTRWRRRPLLSKTRTSSLSVSTSTQPSPAVTVRAWAPSGRWIASGRTGACGRVIRATSRPTTVTSPRIITTVRTVTSRINIRKDRAAFWFSGVSSMAPRR